jgi:hypothetical protein
MSAVDYGYGDAAPDTADYGYGDAAPDSATDYGYGDAPPDSAAAGEQLNGDAAANDADKYGYGDSNPDNAANHGNGNDHHEYEIGMCLFLLHRVLLYNPTKSVCTNIIAVGIVMM